MAQMEKLIELFANQQQTIQQQMDLQRQQMQQMQEQVLAVLGSKNLNQQDLSDKMLLTEKLADGMEQFFYDPDSDMTFDSWYKRYEDLFMIDAAHLDDAARTRLLLRKLDGVSYAKYERYILPKKPRDINFQETVKLLRNLFDPKRSVFSLRYKCMQLVKDQYCDIDTHAGLVNHECELFNLAEITADQFKCLIFVCSLKSPTDSEYRQKLISKIEADPSVTIQQLAEEYSRLVNLELDTKLVGEAPAVNTTNRNEFSKPNFDEQQQNLRREDNNRVPEWYPPRNKMQKRACWACGGPHLARNCPNKQPMQ